MVLGTMVKPATPAAAVFRNFLREYVFIVFKILRTICNYRFESTLRLKCQFQFEELETANFYP